MRKPAWSQQEWQLAGQGREQGPAGSPCASPRLQRGAERASVSGQGRDGMTPGEVL